MDVYFGPLSFVYLKGLRHSADPLRVDGCMAAGRQAIVSEILALGPSRRSDLKIIKRRTHLGGSLRTDREIDILKG